MTAAWHQHGISVRSEWEHNEMSARPAANMPYLGGRYSCSCGRSVPCLALQVRCFALIATVATAVTWACYWPRLRWRMARGAARVVCSGRFAYGIYSVYLSTLYICGDFWVGIWGCVAQVVGVSMKGLGMLQQEREPAPRCFNLKNTQSDVNKTHDKFQCKPTSSM